MKAYSKPCSYRLMAHQEAWLAKQAEKDGYTTKVNVLRRIIDQAMKKEKA